MADNKNRNEYTTNVYTTDVDNVSFLGNPHIDNIMTTLMAMGNEMWVTRKRMHVMESLLAKKGVTAEMIEQYEPTDEEKAAWHSEREVMVSRLYSHFTRDAVAYDFTSDFKDK